MRENHKILGLTAQSSAFHPLVCAMSQMINIVDDATDSRQTIYLNGKSVSPNATLTPPLLDFGNQTVRKSSMYRDVTLLNSGTSTLTITGITTSSPKFELRAEIVPNVRPDNREMANG